MLTVDLDLSLLPVASAQTSKEDPIPAVFGELLRSKKGKVHRRLVRHDLPTTGVYHRNYMEYLEQCWSAHRGVVLAPDHIWYTLLSELALLVNVNPEQVRHVFTTSKEKVNILLPVGAYVLS